MAGSVASDQRWLTFYWAVHPLSIFMSAPRTLRVQLLEAFFYSCLQSFLVGDLLKTLFFLHIALLWEK